MEPENEITPKAKNGIAVPAAKTFAPADQGPTPAAVPTESINPRIPSEE